VADTVVTAGSQSPTEQPEQHGEKKLSAFLCWAVVFADIGTSVYYVPGILWHQVQWQSGLFVLLTLIAFTLLVFTYAEVSVRFPEGGGVVTAAANGFGPLAGVVGGMFILTSYFLTSAISSLSGLLYFSTIFDSIFPYVLVITIVMIILLGLLNFWGIKESASVSAFIAVAALISDVIILIVVFLNVPPATIGLVLQKVLTGNLSGVTILIGFSGAFLAFSGLESISQLSPVMALPRRKTVSWALALVALTVGITSPLLTIFSTVLLNSPDLLATTNIRMDISPTPETFVSDLGGAYGGAVLSIATALAASTLLVFACNTAIIGAYHVFMALSRMGYLPKFITAINAWRGTPHFAILLATLIPVLVLLAVGGKIDVLGDLYAFGLLGAFSMTCLSMSVIRFRERRGSKHISAVGIAEQSLEATQLAPPGASWPSRIRGAAGARMNPQVAARLRMASERTQHQLEPWRSRLKRAWPTINFYVGVVTTILVGVAWLTNLFSKPAATIFGGGFTVVGVGVAYLYHHRLQQQGVAPVAPVQRLQRMADSLLVALSSVSDYDQNHAVIDAAIETADNHQLVFLYLSRKPTQSPRFMQFADPYLTDIEAQKTLAYANNKARRAGLKASFVYRLGGAGQVIDIWRIVRPDEIIAEAEIAKKVSKYVPPDYVRYQQEDGVRVAHYVRHRPSPTHQTPPLRAGSRIAVGDGQLGGPESARQEAPPAADSERNGRAPIAESPHRPPRPPQSPQPLQSPPQPPRPPQTRAPEARSPEPSGAQTGDASSADDEDWIWTGTDLIPKTPETQSDEEASEPPKSEEGTET
jgi:amino acid transporter